MDASYEDKIYRQIEQNLSNNINEKYYVPIERIDKSAYLGRNNVMSSQTYNDGVFQTGEFYDKDSGKVNNEWLKNQEDTDRLQEEKPVMSRSEYIRLAREACLRQLYALESSAGSSHNYVNEEIHNSLFGKKKKDKISGLFQEGKQEDTLSEEFASYKSLLIRTVCAIVIFISIFIIDKIKVKWGDFSYETIKHYVTGYNQLEKLEEIIVSWLK